ncbi:MAG: hypothetical protein ACPGC9_00855 [Cytophagales bacterium]
MKKLVVFLKQHIRGIFLFFLLVANLGLLYVLIERRDDGAHRYIRLATPIDVPISSVESGKVYREKLYEHLGFVKEDKGLKTWQQKPKGSIQRIYDITHVQEEEESKSKSFNRIFRNADVVKKMEGGDWMRADNTRVASSAGKAHVLFDPRFVCHDNNELASYDGVSEEIVENVLGFCQYPRAEQDKRGDSALPIVTALFSFIPLGEYNLLHTIIQLGLQWQFQDSNIDFANWIDELGQKFFGRFFSFRWLLLGAYGYKIFFKYAAVLGVLNGSTSLLTLVSNIWKTISTPWFRKKDSMDLLIPHDPQSVNTLYLISFLDHCFFPFDLKDLTRLICLVALAILVVSCYLFHRYYAPGYSFAQQAQMCLGGVWIFSVLLSLGWEIFLFLSTGRRNTYIYLSNKYGKKIADLKFDGSLGSWFDYLRLGRSNVLNTLSAILSPSDGYVVSLLFIIILNLISNWSYYFDRWSVRARFSVERKSLMLLFNSMKNLARVEGLKDVPELKSIRYFFEKEKETKLYKFLDGLTEYSEIGRFFKSIFEIFMGSYEHRTYVRYMYDKEGKEGANAWKAAVWSYYRLIPSNIRRHNTGFTRVQWDAAMESTATLAKRPYFVFKDLSNRNEEEQGGPVRNTIDFGKKHGVTIITGSSKPVMACLKAFNWAIFDAIYYGGVQAKSAKINAPDAIFYIDGAADSDITYKELNQAYRYAKDNPDKAVLVMVIHPFLKSDQAARSIYAYCRRFAALQNTTAVVYAPYPEFYDLAKADNFGFYCTAYDQAGGATGRLVKGMDVQPLQATVEKMDPDARKEFLDSVNNDGDFLRQYDLNDVNPDNYTNALLILFLLLFAIMGVFVLFSKRRIL